MPLTDAKIRTSKPAPKPVKMSDGGGLHLEVRPSGAKLWRYRYRIADKANVFAIGEYPAVSLAEARVERDKPRALVKQGLHPSHHRRAARLSTQVANANTFEALANEQITRTSTRGTPHHQRTMRNL